VRPFIVRHLSSPEVTNWSHMIWAPLLKSPNCASQMVKPLGLAKAYPYSKPLTAYSESKLLYTLNFAWPSRIWLRRISSSSLSSVFTTAWR